MSAIQLQTYLSKKMRQRQLDKQRQQAPPIERSKSADAPLSKVSQTNSVKSQLLTNKQPCDSHCFEMRPLNSSADTYYQQRLQFYFTHETKQSRPYPILLKEFVGIEYLPIFGNENQIENFRKHKNKYKSSFYEEKSKASIDEVTKKDLTTPVPKHKYCQVCKMEFQAYEKHIYEQGHVKKIRGSFGNTAIDECIEQYIQVRQNIRQSNEFIFIKRLAAAIKESGVLFKLELTNYAEELNILNKRRK